MKRVISASFIALLLIGMIGGGFFYFKKYKSISDKAINAIPPDAAFFIDYYPDAGNLKKILNSNFYADINHEKGWKKLVKALSDFDSILSVNSSLRTILFGGHMVISVHITKAADFDFLYLISLPPGYDDQDCEALVKTFTGESGMETQTRNYDGANIRELQVPGHASFTFTVTKGVFAGSATSFLVEDAIRQQKLKKPFGGDQAFFSIYDRESIHHEDKIYFKYNNLPRWFTIFTDVDKNVPFSFLSNFGGWTCLGFQAEKDHVTLNGFSVSGDSGKYLNVFSNQLPAEMKLTAILPSKTAAFIYFGMSNSRKYFTDLKKYIDINENGSEKDRYINTLEAIYKISIREKMQSWIGNQYALVITEPASTNYDNNMLAFFSTSDSDLALKKLREFSSVVSEKQTSKLTEEKYNGYTIGLINLKDIMQSLYGDAFKRVNKLFFTAVKGYVVISNQASSLRNYIEDYENKKFLFADDEKNILKYQSSSCNFCFYSRIPACNYIFKSVASREAIDFLDQYKSFSQWNAFSFMIKSTTEGYETSGYLQYAQKTSAGATQIWTTELDTLVASGPFFVDRGSGQKNILVQDAANTVYLIDNGGNITWRVMITEKINSEVFSLDVYKNGQSQFFFSTKNYLYMLDLEGKNLNNFPIKLPVPASNSAVVFDYDKSNEYRIYVACINSRVYGYQVNGKPLPGWNFNTLTGPVTDPLMYFHKNETDYIVFNDTTGKVFVVNKMGESLITVNQLLVKQQGSLFFLDDDKEGNFSFVTIDSSGNLCSVMPDGFIRVHPVMEYGQGFDFIMSDIDHDDENDFIFNDGQQLLIYQMDSIRVFARIPGEKAVKSLVKFNSKDGDIKIGTWSTELNKLYLYNRDGSLCKGFPVKGGHRFYLDEINNDGRKNILTSSGKEVLLYVLD